MNGNIIIEAELERKQSLSNRGNAERTYDVNAAVRTMQGGSIGSIEQGTVGKDGMQLANFTCHGGNTLSINFNGVKDIDRPAILAEIEQFISDVKEEGGEA